MTNQASTRVTQPHMATKLPIKHYETHTTTKIHGETIPTVILARALQDQPSPSKPMWDFSVQVLHWWYLPGNHP